LVGSGGLVVVVDGSAAGAGDEEGAGRGLAERSAYDRIWHVDAGVAELARCTRYGRARTVLQIQGVASWAVRGFRYVAGHGVADRVCAGVDG